MGGSLSLELWNLDDGIKGAVHETFVRDPTRKSIQTDPGRHILYIDCAVSGILHWVRQTVG